MYNTIVLFVPQSECLYGSDTGLRNHWPCALEPTPSFYAIHFISCRRAKCLFSFSQDCSLLSGSLALSGVQRGCDGPGHPAWRGIQGPSFLKKSVDICLKMPKNTIKKVMTLGIQEMRGILLKISCSIGKMLV